jgi:hypothetical protein
LQLSDLFKLTSVQGWEKQTIYWYSQGHLQPSLNYEEVSENPKGMVLKKRPRVLLARISRSGYLWVLNELFHILIICVKRKENIKDTRGPISTFLHYTFTDAKYFFELSFALATVSTPAYPYWFST